MTVLEKNIQKLEMYWMIDRDRIMKIGLEREMENVFSDISMSGENIYGVMRDGRAWYLESRYSAETCAKIFGSAFDKHKYQDIYFILGFSSGRSIREALRHTEAGNYIVVYEPNPYLFYKVIEQEDITDIIESDRLYLAVEKIDIQLLDKFFMDVMGYQHLGHILVYQNLNYKTLYPQSYQWLYERIKTYGESYVLNKNTELAFSKEAIRNMLLNFKDMPMQYTTTQLRKRFEKEHMEEIPAIVVAAGPSLDKNIHLLKKAKGRALIIATDTALKTILKHHVKPDLIVTVDALKAPQLFAREDVLDVPVVMCSQSNRSIRSFLRGKRFYFGNEQGYIKNLYQRVGNAELEYLVTGGSVANTAYALAGFCGCRHVILIGQDLAYTGLQTHAGDAYGTAKEAVLSDEEQRELIAVEGVDGSTVYTNKGMECYLRWFERAIEMFPEIELIDSTEGGAKIRGSKIMTFQESIDTYCGREVNFDKMIDEINPVFSVEIQRKMMEEMEKLPEHMEQYSGRIKKGIRTYQKMYELYKKGKSGSGEINRCMNEIGEINYDIEHNPLMELTTYYNREEEYEVLESVYDVEEDMSSEMRSVVESGVKMLQSYVDSCKKFKEDFIHCTDIDVQLLNEQREIVEKAIKEAKQLFMDGNIAEGNGKMNTVINGFAYCMSGCMEAKEEKFKKLYHQMRDIFYRIIHLQEQEEYIELADCIANDGMECMETIKQAFEEMR